MARAPSTKTSTTEEWAAEEETTAQQATGTRQRPTKDLTPRKATMKRITAFSASKSAPRAAAEEAISRCQAQAVAAPRRLITGARRAASSLRRFLANRPLFRAIRLLCINSSPFTIRRRTDKITSHSNNSSSNTISTTTAVAFCMTAAWTFRHHRRRPP